MRKLPVWLHVSGVVSAATAFGGMVGAIMDPSGEVAALMPLGFMGVFATSQIASERLGKR